MYDTCTYSIRCKALVNHRKFTSVCKCGSEHCTNSAEHPKPWYFKTLQRQVIKYFLTSGGVSTCKWILLYMAASTGALQLFSLSAPWHIRGGNKRFTPQRYNKAARTMGHNLLIAQFSLPSVASTMM
jgi:hypothetical protein